MPNKRVIAAAVRTIQALPGWPALRVLDLSCGEGYLIEAIAKTGCRVEGTHFRRGDYIVKSPSSFLANAVIHEGVDLAKPLPFADGTYDVVISTEVMEHLPSHVLLCAEAARILKPGGTFIFSTPNIHRLSSRLQFMLTGQHQLLSARLGWETPPGDLYSTHFNPVYFPVIHTLLYHNGLRIRSLLFTKMNPWAVLFLPFYPLFCLAAAVEARHALKRSREGGRDLLRWMNDLRMLFSNKLMIVTEKTR